LDVSLAIKPNQLGSADFCIFSPPQEEGRLAPKALPGWSLIEPGLFCERPPRLRFAQAPLLATRGNEGWGYGPNMHPAAYPLRTDPGCALGIESGDMRRLFFVLLCVLTQAVLLPAKDPKWFEASSEHFLLFTDTSEVKARRLIADLENRIE